MVTDRPSHQEANDKSEVALQAQKKSNTSRKGPKAAQGGPSTLPSQPRHGERDRAVSHIITGSNAPPYDSISTDTNRGRLLTGTKVRSAHKQCTSKPASFPAVADVLNDASGRMLAT